MYLENPLGSLIETITEKSYLERIKKFRERIEDIDTRVLERYRSFLKPKNFLDNLFLFFFKSDRAIRFYETSEVLEERALSDKSKSD